ncbi:hypothetical protein ABE67_08515 [Cytobacillus firmus]|nr:hypothetical protein [Cytobacillus firmus]
MGKVFRAGPVSLFGQYKGKSVRVSPRPDYGTGEAGKRREESEQHGSTSDTRSGNTREISPNLTLLEKQERFFLQT